MGCGEMRRDAIGGDAMQNEMRWDAMGCDEMRWDAMGCDGMRCDEVRLRLGFECGLRLRFGFGFQIIPAEGASAPG